jgi:IS30 family transposase
MILDYLASILMERKYKRLTLQDREYIGKLLIQGFNQVQIAQFLGVHRSTISREIDRNKEGRLGYIFLLAQRKTEQRRAHYTKKLDRHAYLKQDIIKKLKLGWSPNQIAGRSKFSSGKTSISHETIYRYLFSEAGIEQKLYLLLHSRQKRRFPKIARRKVKRSLIPNRTSIHDRPESIASRQDFGHWEADLVCFSQNKKANIFTMRERKSRYMLALKNPNRSPHTINQTLLGREQLKYSLKIKSITFDNDIAFRQHEELARAFDATTYFCDPFKSHQKGAIENANRLLRRYCPRKGNIDALTQEELDGYIERINSRPLKCLGYKTPAEVYFKLAVDEINAAKKIKNI